MRRLHVSARRPVVRLPEGRREGLSARALLGWDHPLVRGYALADDLRKQSQLTAGALLAGAVASAFGSRDGHVLLVAAGIVQLGLAVGLFLLARVREERARELILSGHARLPLQMVEQTARRLVDPRRRARLAKCLERLVRAAEQWSRLVPASRPVVHARLVRATASDLRWIAARLREPTTAVAAVARVEQLLTSGGSPLYGRREDELRHELLLIRSAFDRADPAGTAWGS